MPKEAENMFPGLCFHHIDKVPPAESGLGDQGKRRSSVWAHNRAQTQYDLMSVGKAPKNELDRAWQAVQETNLNLDEDLRSQHAKKH